MVASAGPDEYRQAIEVALTRRRRRRADRHLHAGRSRLAAETLWRRFATASPPAARAAATAKAGAGVRHGGAGRAGAARSSTARRCRPTRFRKTPRGRSARSPPTPSGARQPPALFWGFDDIRADDARDVCRRVARRARRRLADRRGDHGACSRPSACRSPPATLAHGRRSGGAGARARIPGGAKLQSRARAAQERHRRRAARTCRPRRAVRTRLRRAASALRGRHGVRRARSTAS